MFLQLLIWICLSVIVYQDMRYRAVYWMCFPVLTIMLFIYKDEHAGLTDALADAGYGAAFVGLQLFLVWAYIFMKHQRPVNIVDHYLGLGDVLFLLSLVFYFSPVNYALFYIGSLIIVLAYALIQVSFYKRKNLRIPLAGLQALCFMLLLVLSVIYRDLKIYSDFWIWKLTLQL